MSRWCYSALYIQLLSTYCVRCFYPHTIPMVQPGKLRFRELKWLIEKGWAGIEFHSFQFESLYSSHCSWAGSVLLIFQAQLSSNREGRVERCFSDRCFSEPSHSKSATLWLHSSHMTFAPLGQNELIYFLQMGQRQGWKFPSSGSEPSSVKPRSF